MLKQLHYLHLKPVNHALHHEELPLLHKHQSGKSTVSHLLYFIYEYEKWDSSFYNLKCELNGNLC